MFKLTEYFLFDNDRTQAQGKYTKVYLDIRILQLGFVRISEGLNTSLYPENTRFVTSSGVLNQCVMGSICREIVGFKSDDEMERNDRGYYQNSNYITN